jgi:transcriptional regulator with XRE-family HTH domain
MAKPYEDLRKKMSPESRARSKRRAEELLREINLRELRKAFTLTQKQLAETLKINQAAISKMESQSDMYISTLRRILEAMGGSLKIVAEFPGGEVVIKQFTQEDEARA